MTFLCWFMQHKAAYTALHPPWASGAHKCLYVTWCSGFVVISSFWIGYPKLAAKYEWNDKTLIHEVKAYNQNTFYCPMTDLCYTTWPREIKLCPPTKLNGHQSNLWTVHTANQALLQDGYIGIQLRGTGFASCILPQVGYIDELAAAICPEECRLA